MVNSKSCLGMISAVLLGLAAFAQAPATFSGPSPKTMSSIPKQATGQKCGWMPGPGNYAIWGCTRAAG